MCLILEKVILKVNYVTTMSVIFISKHYMIAHTVTLSAVL
jgi:hypothetical protein